MVMDDVPAGASGDPQAEAAQAVEGMAETAWESVAAVDAMTEEGISAAGQAAEKAVSDTARAFEEARDRLNTMSATAAGQGAGLIEQFKAGAENLTASLGPSYEQASRDMAAFNAKAVAAWRVNAEASLAHWQSLVGIRSWSEIIALNTSHARRQIETVTAQTRELAELAGRIARSMGEPVSSPAAKID